MATIRERKFLYSYLFEVQIRRKGIKSLTVSFGTLEEAVEWAEQHEFRYLENPEEYTQVIDNERLKKKWRREQKRAQML